MTDVRNYKDTAKGNKEDPFPVETIQQAVDLTKKILADRITGLSTKSMDYIVVHLPDVGPVVVYV